MSRRSRKHHVKNTVKAIEKNHSLAELATDISHPIAKRECIACASKIIQSLNNDILCFLCDTSLKLACHNKEHALEYLLNHRYELFETLLTTPKYTLLAVQIALNSDLYEPEKHMDYV